MPALKPNGSQSDVLPPVLSVLRMIDGSILLKYERLNFCVTVLNWGYEASRVKEKEQMGDAKGLTKDRKERKKFLCDQV